MAGVGGMLGEAFYKKFNKEYELKCTDIDVNEKWISNLDFRDFESYKNDVTEFRSDWLFHIGAFTDLEYCELHEKDTYDETDQPNPIGIYAKSKYFGEKYVIEYHARLDDIT